MDNVCHTLVGAAFGEAGLNRRTRFGAAALMISANLPDVDVLVFATNAPAVAFRRGWTHGIAAQLLLPLMLTAIFLLLGRLGRARPKDDGPPVHGGWLLLLSYAGVYSHVFLDYLNNYGVRLAAPISWQWFYGDAVFIIDPWLWLVLAAGIWVARRQRVPVAARAAILCATCYVIAMLVSARAARGIVETIWRDARGTEPRAMMVGPVPLTPFTRDVIVDAGDHYERGTYSWWATEVTFDPRQIAKNADRPEVAIARQALNVRAFLVWSRFPLWTLQPGPDGTRVTVSDVRFAGGGRVFEASTVVPTNEQ
ncbi:MAG TPA: metal-dependent hydrolase [Vicinamibacterales bacterium]|nr:metal-dependent hydrolase [Vicinamibacterales bacterium]